MSEHQRQHDPTTTQKLHHTTAEATSNSRRAIKFLTATAIGTVLLSLSGLTLTGTVIALIVATPVLVIFSPILVPAAIAVFLIASGFVVSGGCGVVALSVLSWIYQYATGKHPPGSNQLDRARMKITGAAREGTEKTKGNMQYVQHKSQEGTTGTTHHQQQITS